MAIPQNRYFYPPFENKGIELRKVKDFPKARGLTDGGVRTESQVCSWFKVCTLRWQKDRPDPMVFPSILASIIVLTTQFMFGVRCLYHQLLTFLQNIPNLFLEGGTYSDISMVVS